MCLITLLILIALVVLIRLTVSHPNQRRTEMPDGWIPTVQPGARTVRHAMPDLWTLPGVPRVERPDGRTLVERQQGAETVSVAYRSFLDEARVDGAQRARVDAILADAFVNLRAEEDAAIDALHDAMLHGEDWQEDVIAVRHRIDAEVEAELAEVLRPEQMAVYRTTIVMASPMLSVAPDPELFAQVR
jgi:hypothetical protein